jgi:hypothetical protein
MCAVIKSKVLKKLLYELLIPLIVGFLWASYVLYSTPLTENKILLFTQNFFTALFLSAWFTGQFLRVKKQTETEEKFKEVLDNITGGDSLCKIIVGSINQENMGVLYIENLGEHSIYDLKARFSQNERGNTSTLKDLQNNTTDIGTLFPKSTDVRLIPIQLDPIKGLSWNIFYVARNGRYHQLLRMKFHEGKWLYANRIIRARKTVYEQVDNNFPKNGEDIFK